MDSTSPVPGGNATTPSSAQEMSLISSELLPALLNIFAVILVGYLIGRFKVLPREAVRVVAKVAGMILLPVLLFCGIATIDFYGSTFQDMKVFLIGISIAKTGVFVIVAVLCLLTDRSVDKWGKAGIRGIFVTQQNDFSLGLPIFAALYSKSHPEFMAMLFLAAPVNLIFLNPVAFTMMEYSRTQKEGVKFGCKTMLKIVLKVVRNPITWSAFLGLIVNFCTKGTLPPILYAPPTAGLLGVVKAAFPFISQFSLGLVIVGKLKSMRPRYLPVPSLLIFCKVILLPIVGKIMIDALSGGIDLSAATFIYCAIPTTGGVFLYAIQYVPFAVWCFTHRVPAKFNGVFVSTAHDRYDMSPHRVAIAMVLCTVISAPVLLVLAVLATVNTNTIEQFFHLLPQYLLVPAYITIVGCIWYLISSCWARKRWGSSTSFQRHCILILVLTCVVVAGTSLVCQIPEMANNQNDTAAILYVNASMFVVIQVA